MYICIYIIYINIHIIIYIYIHIYIYTGGSIHGDTLTQMVYNGKSLFQEPHIYI